MNTDKIENKSDKVNAGGGAYIDGPVNTNSGDFVGRDKIIHGDVVNGDKVEKDKNVFQTFINYFSADREQQRDLRNRQNMLKLVKNTWIEGFLKQSLRDGMFIDLEMHEYSGAVERPWDNLVVEPDQSDPFIFTGKNIVDMIDYMNNSLLILGEPGSGKTMKLLEITQGLIERAETDLGKSIPVVLNLSSWSESRKPIAEWIVYELRTKYYIPEKISHPWVANDELLLLLDGLDEVLPKYRDNCVLAINQFRQEHMTPMVISSRMADYEALSIKLKLNKAFVINPITREQAEHYLDTVGSELLIDTLRNDKRLQELATSPLVLNIMARSYKERSGNELRLLDTSEERVKHILQEYVQQNFLRRRMDERYKQVDTMKWLTWQAKQMLRHSQTLFLVEHMQPNWLPSNMQINLYALGILLMICIPIGLLVGFGGGYPVKLGTPMVNWWFGIGLGLSAALTACIAIIRGFDIVGSIIVGTCIGLTFVLAFGMFFGASIGLLVGSVVGVSFGLLFGLVGRRLTNRGTNNLYHIEIVETLKWSWSKAVPGLALGFIFGYLGGAIIGWAIYKPIAYNFGMAFGLAAGLVASVFTGLMVGEIKEKTTPNQGVWQSARNAIFIGLAVSLAVGIPLGVVFGNAWGRYAIFLGSSSVGIVTGITIGITLGIAVSLFFGGLPTIQHLILRILLYFNGNTPKNYINFLDYATERILLRKVGGGYIFIHRMLLEHFAKMDEDRIEAMSMSSPKDMVND
jgi:hypothetical protein